MIRVEKQNIDFDLDNRVYEAYILYDTIEESEAIYKEFFTDFGLDEYDRGEITLTIESHWYDTKKQFMKEIRSRVRDLNRYA